MINLLIADSDLNFAKKIINQIIRKDERLRLIDIASNTQEMLDACKSDKPQLIIINTDIINVLKLDNLDYTPNLLLFTDSISNNDSNQYLSKDADIMCIEKEISKIIFKNDSSKNKSLLLNTFGMLKFNLSRIGTKFLMESILYSYENRELLLYKNLEKNVYPEIAKRNNTTPSNVKWVIIKSINEMYNRNYIENSLDSVCHFFYFTDYSKPTAKIILTTMLGKLDE